jgi:hypothetical protein
MSDEGSIDAHTTTVDRSGGMIETNTDVLDFYITAPPPVNLPPSSASPVRPSRRQSDGNSSAPSSALNRLNSEEQRSDNSIDLSGDDDGKSQDASQQSSPTMAKVGYPYDADIYLGSASHYQENVARLSNGSEASADSGIGYFDELPDTLTDTTKLPTGKSMIKTPAVVVRKMTTTVRNVAVSESLPPSTPDGYRNRLEDKSSLGYSPHKVPGRYLEVPETKNSANFNEEHSTRMSSVDLLNPVFDYDVSEPTEFAPPLGEDDEQTKSPIAACDTILPPVQVSEVQVDTEIGSLPINAAILTVDIKPSVSLQSTQKPPLPPTRISQLSATDSLMSTQANSFRHMTTTGKAFTESEQFPLDFSENFRPPPLSIYAQRMGYVYEGWLEKRSARTGFWLKRYFVLAESTEHICVLLQFSRAVDSVWGMIPLDLRKVIPLSSIIALDVSSKPTHFSVTEVATDTRYKKVSKPEDYQNASEFLQTGYYSDGSSVNSDSVYSENSGQHTLKLRTPNPVDRLCWVTLIQKARAVIVELGRE